MPQSDIAVEHSANDVGGKTFGIVCLGLLLLFPFTYVRLHAALVSGFPNGHLWIAGGWLALLVTTSVGYLAWLQSRFKTMDTTWREAIQQLFDGDIKRKMIAIRNCMKAYRHFIKWGRTVSYFFYFSIVVWLVEGMMALATLGYAWLGLLRLFPPSSPPWRFDDTVLLIVGAGVYPVVLFFYGFLGWLYANFRDPTLQLCVMLAEEHNKVVETKIAVGG
jgi:hypothetical protein